MEWISFLLYITMLPKPINDKIYSHEEIICNYTYSTIRQWRLELKEQGTFRLRYSNERTGLGKKKVYDLIGTWVNRNDTVTLAASPTLMNDCYFRTAQLVTEGVSLKPVTGGNECLPRIFEYGIRFSMWDGHMF